MSHPLQLGDTRMQMTAIFGGGKEHISDISGSFIKNASIYVYKQPRRSLWRNVKRSK